MEKKSVRVTEPFRLLRLLRRLMLLVSSFPSKATNCRWITSELPSLKICLFSPAVTERSVFAALLLVDAHYFSYLISCALARPFLFRLIS